MAGNHKIPGPLETQFSNGLHHAYLLVAEDLSFLDSILDQLEIRRAGNPDFLIYRLETFGISEARELSAKAVRKSFSDRKIFAIHADTMTLEAQNALLKTFEEPYPGTHFFVLVREEEMLIPTLRSRMMILKSEAQETKLTEAEKFLSLGIKERLLFVKKFIEEERQLAPFLDNLLKVLKEKREPVDKIDRIFSMRRFAEDRSASSRLILEHLSLVI